MVELAYAGLVGMRNLSDDQAHPFLFAEAPRILFPFARKIIADAEYGDSNVARPRVRGIFLSRSSHERWDEVWVTDGK